MRLPSWLDGPKLDSSRRQNKHGEARDPRRQPARFKLSVETLEDRCLLSFSPAVSYLAGTGPQAVLTADFNGDTRLDLAVFNNGASSVNVLLGNADGTFQPALNSATGAYPYRLAVGDFNADGKLDLATANANDWSVLLGNGDGTFQPAQNTALALYPPSLAVGDLNGDGKLDLVATTSEFTCTSSGYYGCYDGYYTGKVHVLLGDGDGSFAAPTAQLLNDSYLTSAVLQDINADGKLDLATTDSYGSRVRVLAGNGDGTFGAPVDYTTGSLPQSVVVGDVNRDGISDLVTRNNSSLSVLLGNGNAGVGNGTFQPAQNTALQDPISLAVGDFNADGKLDLVVTSRVFTCTHYGDYGCYDGFHTGSVNVLLGHGDGTFATPRTATVEGSYLASVATGDFNRDGFPDVAVTDSNKYNVSVLLNDRTWPPSPPPPPPSVSFNEVTVTEGNTGTVNATFTLTLSFASDVDVTVHYATTNITATAGSDYTAASGEVIIPAGQTSRTLTVAVTGDRLAEPTETFVVNLSAPANATIGDGQGIGTILDDEPRISINDVTVTEGNSGAVNATFTLSLSVAYDAAVTVHYQTANGSATAGSDYAAASGDVLIAAGQTNKTFTVAVSGDRSAEPTENFVVNLSAANNGLIVDSQGVGTILDNEPRISISDVAKKEGKKNQTTQFTFTVTLSAAYTEAVTMSYRTVNGTATASDGDYIAKTGTLTFAPGQTSKTITIEVKGDSKREANETFYLDLFGNSSNSLFIKNRGIGTILNDD